MPFAHSSHSVNTVILDAFPFFVHHGPVVGVGFDEEIGLYACRIGLMACVVESVRDGPNGRMLAL